MKKYFLFEKKNGEFVKLNDEAIMAEDFGEAWDKLDGAKIWGVNENGDIKYPIMVRVVEHDGEEVKSGLLNPRLLGKGK